MGPRLARRGIALPARCRFSTLLPSMGPRLARRGIERYSWLSGWHQVNLQWVHGSLAVVSKDDMVKRLEEQSFNGSTARSPWYRPETWINQVLAEPPSMGPRLARRGIRECWGDSERTTASMGPRLARRGIVCMAGERNMLTTALQWVHGSLAVVSALPHGSLAVVSGDAACNASSHSRASMGPRLARRGIAGGPDSRPSADRGASMGPRLARRGIGSP